MVMKQRSSAGTILLTIIIGIAVLLLVAEFGLRWFIGNQVVQALAAQDTQTSSEQKEKPKISFGLSPLLLGLVKGEIPHVELDTPSTINIKKNADSTISEITGVPKTRMVADGLSLLDSENPTARTMTLEVEPDDAFLLAMVQSAVAQQDTSGDTDASDLKANLQGLLQQVVKVTKVTSNPQNSTIDVEFTNGAATLTLKPKVQDGNLGFDAVNTALFGFALPSEVTETVSKGLNENISKVNTNGMATDEVTVIDGGLRIKMRGQNVKLSAASESMPTQ